MGVLIFVNLGKKNTFGPKNEKFWEITKNIFGPKKKLFFKIWLGRPWIAAKLHAGSKKSSQKNFMAKSKSVQFFKGGPYRKRSSRYILYRQSLYNRI